jgi:alkylation response protein AidB-like acyl-CoA dehydrogenase
MDLMQSTEQDAIQQTVRSFLENELPLARMREIAASRDDMLAGIWRGAGELGFFGLGLGEGAGGAGYSLTEEMILFEEIGRALAPGAWLGSVIAGHALEAARDAAPRAALSRILAGELRVALIERSEGEPLQVAKGRVSGARRNVADAVGAGALLVLEESRVLYIPCEGSGVSIDPRPSLDPSRRVANVAFRDAACVALEGIAAAELRRRATVLSCADAVGGTQRTVEMSVEYGKVRHQFGKPIGSFQAVKHRCADMAVRAEMARSATIYATVSVRDRAADADFQVSVAKLLCAEAYIQNAADNVQNHGGMGFTWECDAHLFVKRARSFDVVFGSRRAQLDRIVDTFRQ